MPKIMRNKIHLLPKQKTFLTTTGYVSMNWFYHYDKSSSWHEESLKMTNLERTKVTKVLLLSMPLGKKAACKIQYSINIPARLFCENKAQNQQNQMQCAKFLVIGHMEIQNSTFQYSRKC